MLDGLENSGGWFDEGSLSQMADDDEFVVLGLGVHAVIGLDLL